MSRHATLLGLLVSLCLLSACAPKWQSLRNEEAVKGPSRAYTAVLPEGWKRAPTDGDVLLITRDGLFLQQISITRVALSDAFAPAHITHETPLQELALMQYKALRELEPELVRIDDDERKGVLALFPVSNAKPLAGTTERVTIKPYKVDGHDAFLLVTRNFNSWGLEYTSQAIGFVHAKDYWLVRYLAPSLHYAKLDQLTFDTFVQRIKLKDKCILFCSD